MTPTEVQEFLQEQGYLAKLEEEGAIQASIVSGFDGIKYHIAFWRPEPFDGDLGRFENFTFLALAEPTERSSFEVLNNANSEFRFIKTHRDEDTVYFEMDVSHSDQTLTKELFEEVLEQWMTWLPDFIGSTL